MATNIKNILAEKIKVVVLWDGYHSNNFEAEYDAHLSAGEYYQLPYFMERVMQSSQHANRKGFTNAIDKMAILDKHIAEAARKLEERATFAGIKDISGIPEKAFNMAVHDIVVNAKHFCVFVVPDLWLP